MIPPPVRRVVTLEQLRSRLLELEQLARERPAGLDAAERRTLRWLRRLPGVHQPTDPREFAAIAAARIKRRTKGLKRLARAAAASSAVVPAPSHTPENPCTPR